MEEQADHNLSDIDLTFDLNSATPPVLFSSDVGDMILKACLFERTYSLNSTVVSVVSELSVKRCSSTSILTPVSQLNIDNERSCEYETGILSLTNYSTTIPLTVFTAVAKCIAVQCSNKAGSLVQCIRIDMHALSVVYCIRVDSHACLFRSVFSMGNWARSDSLCMERL
ncbi:hypothetical protein BLNAU_11821 [Blattamonas nauphoetae]|uniref:Uncharacterized protein n=1 Tax=Blattamonas nauphoetae TaxID=2049346 RepID=A0ABQ9XL93_9EUKA|nr:hypothetical protein BLNAU_15909 [Blattamonas nauphoetae]KAK2953196.1 hypothetical protein BLNAU_11821 [Blattamonas nauphoetae]